FNMQVTEPEKEAAFYAALMGWKVRSNDSSGIYMDIGDWGGVKIRGGYTPPPRGQGRGGGGGGGGGGGRGRAAGDSAGGGRAGERGRGTRGERAVRKVEWIQGAGSMWDGAAWGIAPWDTNEVEAALKARGLNPVADHDANDYKSFHVKDPDGMDVIITSGTK